MVKMKEFYVYAYCDPRKPAAEFISGFQPFYIGKGTKDRMFDHLQNRKSKNPIFANKINKIKSLGLKPIILKIKDNLSEVEAFQLEKDLISQFGMYPSGCLCNLTEGGVGGKLSDVAIQKIIYALTGKPLREETKRKISERLKGKSRNDATKQKISQTLKGKKLPDERRKAVSEGMRLKYENIANLQRYQVLRDGVPFVTIFGNETISNLFPKVYSSLRTGKPISRGEFKGWQIIKVPRLEAQQSST